MSNNCTHCLHKGDIKACKATECHAHESWYALEMIAQNAKLVEALESITNFGGTFTGEDAREMWLIANDALQQLKEND